MGHPFWPLFDLRVRTPTLELRLPTDDDLVAIARLMDGATEVKCSEFASAIVGRL